MCKKIKVIGAVMILFQCLTQWVLAAQVSSPIFSHETGKYEQAINLCLTCNTPDARIYYTLDGTDPDESDLLYDGGPIVLYHHVTGDSLTGNSDNAPSDAAEPQTFYSATVRAVAIADGMENSEIVQARYVLDLVDASFNIAYAESPAEGGGKHQLDVYQPKNKTNTPVLLFIHGGAWKQGDKELYMELGNTYAGYYNVTTVIANYQLSSDPWNAKHPTHVMDVAMAFAWVVDHIAEYGGDPESIHIMGQSAGAHLCALMSTDGSYLESLGLSTDLIKSAVLMSGAYNLYDLVIWPSNPLGLDAVDALGYKTLCQNTFDSWEEDVLLAASPGNFINVDQPPFLIISLNEEGEFLDMPGFVQDADNFYNSIEGLNGPQVEIARLNVTDIPQEIVDVDFPGETEGHYEEIYAINTKMWNSVSTHMVAENLDVLPATPIPEEATMGEMITFNWQDEKLATHYQLQVATDASFGEADLVFDNEIAGCSWSLDVESGHDYYWRVKSINGLGASEWSEVESFSYQTTDVAETDKVPENLNLISVYPNPFNSTLNTTIQFEPAHNNMEADIRIFDILGRQLHRENVKLYPGQWQLNWKMELDYPTGVYYVVFQHDNTRIFQKAILLE